MNSRFFQTVKLIFFIIEIATINIVLYYYRHLLTNQEQIRGIEYVVVTGMVNLIWWLTIYHNKLEIRYSLSNLSAFVKSSVIRTISYTGVLAFISLLLVNAITSKNEVFNLVGIVFSCLLCSRAAYSITIFLLRKKEFEDGNIIFIGFNKASREMAEQFANIGYADRITGFYDDRKNILELSNHPVFTGIANAIDVCTQHNVTEIYSTISPEENKAVKMLSNHANKTCIRFKMIGGNIVPTEQLFGRYTMPVAVAIQSEPLQYIGNRIIKRGFDVIFSCFVIVFIMSWLMPLIGLLIKIESKGPILFKQLRSGKNNKSFYCYKFRSMYQNNDSDSKQASRNDRRITRIGSFLRRTSLDEFPQFFNVFMGDMSIVGPRPHMIKHTDEYSSLINDYMLRHFVKPGVTGWAQVNGFRGETKTLDQMEKRVEKDIWYMKNWNFAIDIKVILLTVINAVKGEENAF